MTERRCEDVNPLSGLDWSRPETREQLAGLSDLILEIRDEANRTNRLYERTLGLAVIPMLIRRAGGTMVRRWKYSKR